MSDFSPPAFAEATAWQLMSDLCPPWLAMALRLRYDGG